MGRDDRRHRRRGRARGISRRQFIAGTTAAGLTVGLPSWLLGCGSDSGSGPRATPTPTPLPTPEGPRPTEDCDLNFDFEGTDLQELEIHVLGSPDDDARLQVHDAESRAAAREQNPSLDEVADADLTHYVDNITLPSDALQLYWVTGRLDDGEEALAGLSIHVPLQTLQTLAETAAARGLGQVRTAKMRHYGIGERRVQDLTDLYPDVASFVTPFDAALALLFMQPDLLNINVAQGASILQLLQTLPCTDANPCDDPYINTLAFRIASAWPATESGVLTVNGQEVPAWAQLLPVLDMDGNPVMDSDGQPAMTFRPSDDIADTVVGVAGNIRKVILNSPEFEGFNWHPTRGMTTEEDDAAIQTSSRSRVFMSGAQPAVTTQEVQVVGERAQGTTAHGVEFTRIAVVDQTKRTVQVDVRNHYIRFVSAYVRFANEAGDLPVGPGGNNTSRSKFLRLLNSNFTVVGVPLSGNAVELQPLTFDLPANATKARLIFGSLGVGGEAFSPEALGASVLTLGFNIGIPVLMLATGATAVGLQANMFVEQLGPQLLNVLVTQTLALAGPQVATGIFATGNSGDAKPVLFSLGNALISFILTSGLFVVLLKGLGLLQAASKLVVLTGPLGLAMWGASIGAQVSTLAHTVSEVLGNPAIFTNTLSLRMSTMVTIFHDPDNAVFPARARRYEVTLTYDTASKTAHKMTGAIAAGQADPIEVTFDSVPSGGSVSVEVVLTAEDGTTIVGGSTDPNGDLGAFGPIDNTPKSAGAIKITIKEQLVPLSSLTRYAHQRKLAYQSGARVWVDGAPAPTATRADLCQGQDNALCNLVGITVSQRTGNLGYGFQAGGQGVTFCGETGGGVMYRVQNISLLAGTDRNFKELPCGFRQPAGIVYDRLGPANGAGRNFFVQSTANGFFLQSMVLDASTPLGFSPLSWGRFSEPLDSLVVHPMGFVVGVNRDNHKMEILQLPDAAVDSNVAPDAIPFAVPKAGEGDRAGLLRAPVALTVFEGAILVLEAGNLRVQALDVSGNPVNLFGGQTSPTFALIEPNATYLDIGVDGLGYVYVLSFVGAGANASDYRVDIYTPDGVFLTRTPGMSAGRLTVDTFRSVYTLNFETLSGTPHIEPSLSQWVPITPA